MGVPRLFGLCVALFSFSAINVAHANYIYNHSTGVWMPTSTTVLTPPGSSSPFAPSTGIPPNPQVNNGGFSTTSGGSFGSSSANGASQRVPVTIQGHATRVNVNTAVATRLGRGGLYGMALGYGIEQLFNGIDWIINEGGKVSRIDPSAPNSTYHGPPAGYAASQMAATTYDQRLCASIPSPQVCVEVIPNADGITSRARYCQGTVSGYPLTGYDGSLCYYGGDGFNNPPAPVPVPFNDIQDAVDNNYNPHPSDYPLIVSEPSMQPTEITVQPIPRLNFPSVQTTSTDLATGQTTVTDTNIWHDYEIHNNGSQQPKIEEKQTEQKDTYKDGVKTETSTTTSSSGVATGGSSVPAPDLQIELPPFCSWASVVCDWIGWTQEPIEDDLDLAALINDEDYERSYSISFGDNSCPAPIEINIIFLNQTVQLSYEPACQLAIYAKPFVLISAYIFAIFITLGVVRNG